MFANTPTPTDILRAVDYRKHGLIVDMPDGTTYTVKNLLTEQSANMKLAKSGTVGAGFYTVGLSLAPHTLAGMGNVCSNASPGCIAGCLNLAGKGPLTSVQRARVAKTRALLGRDTRAAFVAMLIHQLTAAQMKATRKGLRLAVRLNILSDLPWESMMPWLFRAFPDVQFYDYTKIRARVFWSLRASPTSHFPTNYDLTFSRSETNEHQALDVLRTGGRVAVVFSNRAPLPNEWHGFPVVDADVHDLRFIDGAGVVSGLKAKGVLRGAPVGPGHFIAA